jgi:DNA-binding transcriptional ArsR family regulator
MRIIDEGTAAIALHPVRYKILQFINGASTPQFVEQIAVAIGEHPRLVSHHLNVLQDKGLVECTYEVAKAKGSTRRHVAVRFCKPTPKLSEVFQEIEKAAKQVVEAK